MCNPSNLSCGIGGVQALTIDCLEEKASTVVSSANSNASLVIQLPQMRKTGIYFLQMYFQVTTHVSSDTPLSMKHEIWALLHSSMILLAAVS